MPLSSSQKGSSTCGILTFADKAVEWMIPWWYRQVRLYSDLPIAIGSIGLSPKMQSWCEDRGVVVEINPSYSVADAHEVGPKLEKEWNERYFGDVWKSRPIWFLKPQALSLSPFKKTLFLDLDCEVKQPIDELISVEGPFAICPEPRGEADFNSGVILYESHSSILKEWVKRSKEDNHLFMGDEDLLSDIISHQREAIAVLDQKYNCRPQSDGADEASIIHHVGAGGKRDILATILRDVF